VRIPLEVTVEKLLRDEEVSPNGGTRYSPPPIYDVRLTLLDTEQEQMLVYNFQTLQRLEPAPDEESAIVRTSLESFRAPLRRLRDELDDVLEDARADLRDQKDLALALELLDSKELGAVIALSLGRLDEAGNTPLPELLRRLADNVEREEERRRNER
jgi:hypothetical protein